MIHGMSSMGYFLRIRRHIAAQRPGYFAFTYAEDGTIRATLISGDPGFALFVHLLQAHRFPVLLPTGSKVRLVREVHMVCSPYGGCDACMLLRAKVEIPAMHTVGGREIKALNVRRQPWMRVASFWKRKTRVGSEPAVA